MEALASSKSRGLSCIVSQKAIAGSINSIDLGKLLGCPPKQWLPEEAREVEANEMLASLSQLQASKSSTTHAGARRLALGLDLCASYSVVTFLDIYSGTFPGNATSSGNCSATSLPAASCLQFGGVEVPGVPLPEVGGVEANITPARIDALLLRARARESTDPVAAVAPGTAQRAAPPWVDLVWSAPRRQPPTLES